MQLMTAPSKTQKFNGRAYAKCTSPVLLEKAGTLIDQLKMLDRDQLSRLMKTSERLTESSYRKIHSFTQPFSLDNAKQALFTFQGDAYSAIQAKDYTNEQLQYAQHHLFILSGLYGIMRPLDLMQEYRLEMGCSLVAEGAQNLYQFWQEGVTGIINLALAKDSDRVLVNLASKEYSKVINKKNLQGEMVTITFKQLHKGQLRTIPIHAKRARGQMIHFAISKCINKAKKLKEFNLDGYSFSRKDSGPVEWLFVRTD
jgi:uncharacterized protein